MSKLPTVTHSGEMHLGGLRLRCYRLSDGQAVFDADDFKAFLVAWFGGELDLGEEELRQLAGFVTSGEVP